MSDDTPLEELLQPLLGSGVPGSVTRRQARHDELAARLDAGFDPEYIRDFENFHSMEHAEIYRIAQTISPIAMTTLAGEWAELGKGFSLAVSLGTVMIRDRIARHWEGDAATAAAEATRRFGESAQQLCDAAQAVAQKLHIAADVGERVKSSVPPPTARIPMAFTALDPVAGAEAARQAEAVRVQSVHVMESLYKPYYRDSGAAVPVLPPPFVAATASGGEVAGGRQWGAASESGRDSAGVDPTAGGFGSNRREDLDSATSRTADGPHDNSEDRSAKRENAAQPSPFEASGSDPATTTPAGTSGPSPLPGQPYGSGASGSPAGLGASGGAGGAGGGVSSPWGQGLGAGALGGAAPAGTDRSAPQAAAGSRNGGARPMGMYPGMMPPSSAQGNDDQRRVPGYLVTNDHGSELIGSIPDTAPPVLGADPT
ncbi:hypothetical protein TVH25_16530 [Rhodococcus sp. 7Tela_A2]|uniref:hypothetical protein n=1 Tax=Rhodococcus sp. 7Tela_A2 TaxID=3093744 RepID=UPI003BB520E8